MWNILRSLTNPRKDDPNRVIEEEGKIYKGHKNKADAFLKHYQRASTVKIHKADRPLKRKLNITLRQHQDANEATQLLSEMEVAAAFNFRVQLDLGVPQSRAMMKKLCVCVFGFNNLNC